MNNYVIAKYIRLSMDDAVSESLSIPNQHLILDRHIEELDIPNATVLEFVDNGYTGTNLERPAVQEMLELVRCGGVNCIVTKDFSRFARNAMESGYYIEQVFPLYHVRFIAVGDYFDSSDYKDGTGGIDVAFRFLMHEHYSKDLSMKVSSALRVLMENGEHIVGGAIYGYRKNDSGKWELDPEPAEVVKHIFQYALEGLSTSQIRDKMYEARYLPPREYSDIKLGKDIMPKYNWGTKAIHRILTNEQYTGSYIAGKHKSKHIGGKGQIKTDKSDWIIFPDSHPAIVSKKDFSIVQDMLKHPKELAPVKPVPNKHSEMLRSRTASGHKTPTNAPYGYTRLDGGKWIIDDFAANIVKNIFDMALNGLSSWEISEKLFEAGYASPSEYFQLIRRQNITPTNRWRTLRIREIIKNEAYTGDFISGRTYQDINGKKYHAPKSEWIVIPDMHPPIISKELFHKVHGVFEQNKRKNMRRRNYLLQGKISCGCCGYALSYSDAGFNKYVCPHSRTNATTDCRKINVYAHELEEAVMTIIKKKAELVLESGDLSGLRKIDKGEKRVADCENQIRQCVEQRQNLYEQFIQGEIDRDDFNKLKDDCAAQIDKLNNRLSLYKQSERDKQANKKAVALASEALSETANPQDIVNAFVEKVMVFPNNHLEIHWKFVNFTAGI